MELTCGGFAIGLGTVEAARRVHGVRCRAGPPGDGDRALVRRCQRGVPAARSGRRHGRPAAADTGNNNRNALLRDTDGNLVEIVSKTA